MTSETALSLENLPLLALESICEYLASCDSKRRSLFAFSLTSKRCCWAATRLRFERIRFTLRGEKELQQDVDRWNEILAVDQRVRHVRRVKLVGRMPLADTDGEHIDEDIDEDISEDISKDDEDEDENEDDDDYDEWERDVNGFCDTSPPFPGAGPALTDEEKQRQDEACLPLAWFIAQLPGLVDLIHACSDQIPMCVLSALHQHHPRCRLHIHRFRLHSLCQPKDSPRDIAPDELAIATSPCLYCIGVPYAPYDTFGRADYNEEAVLRMVAGSSPRLSSVRMFLIHPGDSLEVRNAWRTPKPPWLGFHVGESGDSFPSSKGHLQSLVLDGAGSEIETWRNHTDFSELRSVEIRMEVGLAELQKMTRIAEDGGFMSLHTLTLAVYPHDHREQSHTDEATSLLLQALHPLQTLQLDGYVAGRTLVAVMHRHGETLRRLKFTPTSYAMMEVKPYVITVDCIRGLRQHCPNLREVELLTYRTKSNEREASIYRALGSLPRLERASLILECSKICASDTELRGPGVEETEQAGDLRDAFVNVAVDSSLAVSIFRTISTANTIARSTSNHPSFHWLKLRVSGPRNLRGQMVDGNFADIAQWIARNWICTRGPAGGSPDAAVIAEETSKRTRKRSWRTCLDMDMEECWSHGKLLKRVWREIWPEKTGDWREDWWSFPLPNASPD